MSGARRWLAAGVVVTVAAGVVAAGLAGVFNRPSQRGGRAADATSTVVVAQRSLSSQDQVDATLGYAGSYQVPGPGGGTVTALPAVGQVIGEGQVLYRVDNAIPVFLLYGTVPAWRALSEGMTGDDVRQLNRDLVALGYATKAELDPASDYFWPETGYALEQLQARLGLPVTGSLSLGQAVFLPSAIRVTALNAALGSPAAGAVLSGSSTVPVVTVALDADQQTEVKAGDQVTVTLPDGGSTAGVVSSVGSVAVTPAGGGTPTVTVLVTLTSPKASGGLDQAPVEVAITTGSAASALVVPVDALLARPSGGYAVEVTGPGGHYLVAVTPGLFDDAAGLVQVTGSGLAAGQRVVVPAL